MAYGLKNDILRLIKEQASAPEPPVEEQPVAETPAETKTQAPTSTAGAPEDPNAGTDALDTPDEPSPPVDPNAPIEPSAAADTTVAPVGSSGGASSAGMSSGEMVLGGGSTGGLGGGMGSIAPTTKADSETDDVPVESPVEIPDGQPKVDKNDPVGTAYDATLETAKTTIDPQLILNTAKSSIQANFGGRVEDAWPLVQRLKDTENVVLGDVAQRLSLFINGTIQENTKKGKKIMTTNKERPARSFTITEAQLARIIKKTIKSINEGNMFDSHRSQIDQERSAIESQLSGTEVKEMAIDLFEKMCQKAGLNADALTPQAQEYVEKELGALVHNAQDIASKLSHVARVLAAAADKKPTEGKG